MFVNENEPLTAIQWFNKGYDYDVKEDYDNAIHAYSKAIELNPEDADAYYNRGIVYDTKSEYDLAIRDYDQTIALNPRAIDAYISKVEACEKAGHYTSDQIEAVKQKIRDLGGQS